MKKILIALALVASMQVANAQVKPEAALKAVESALATSQNAKKATKASTWMNLGKAYLGAYDAPSAGAWIGATKQELALLLGKESPSSTENVVLNGEQMVKEVYEGRNYYFNGNGQLALIETTKPVVADALPKALEAYKKAAELGAKSADVATALEGISTRYNAEAYNAYTLGDMANASTLFEKAADAMATSPLSKVDTNSLYNAGFTAQAAKDFPRATEMFKKCLANNYYATDGEIYARLADVDTLNAKQYLHEGFEKFPQSQPILIGLINNSIKNKDTQSLFALIDKAKANDPKNASLYYVEGNAYNELGDTDKAVAAYEKCIEINPNYEFGYIGEGIMFYNKAIEDQTKAQEEMDDTKYNELVTKFENDLKACIDPFEKAYNVTKDDSIKVNIAEYLKNAYFRFRDQDPKYQAAYDKYSEIVSTGVAK